MPSFFIDRPIFAWVVALFICLLGVISIPFLPIAQYPIIAPPSISVSTQYPGASPENLYNSVTRLIEEELNGANGILNFESTSDSLGQVEITANFEPGTDTEMASVNVQNRIKRIEARLPRAVLQQGILVEEASSAVLQIITLTSTDGSLDEVGLGDFMIRNVLGEIRRIPGVGRATLYSTERALRIWIDPDKLVGYNLTADEVTKAIEAQNAQVASGAVGAEPSDKGQKISVLVLVKGQLSSADEFGAIVLRANPDGSTVRLRDVARLEIGGFSYQFNTRLNGKPVAGLSVLMSPTGNALATASAVEAKMKELSRFFPANIKYEIPYDTTPFVQASVDEVIKTLVEAMVLVFLVMYLFLQNWRATLIPTLVVPIALAGACLGLWLFGFSINVLSLFGMVLAIGILVDDAIVVIENVERIMREEGLSPLEATRKAMDQITTAIIGITLVLIAVFVPMAFFPGSTGGIYRQFSVTLAIAIFFSAFLALSLTPALCATFLSRWWPCPRRQPALRPLQSHPRRHPRALLADRALEPRPHRPADDPLRGAGRRAGLGPGADARRLPADRRPGLRHRRPADAVEVVLQSDLRRHQEGRGLSAQARRRRQRHLPHRLQLPGPGHERRAGVRDAEGLVRARRQVVGRCDRGRRQQGARLGARRAYRRTAAAADRQPRQFVGLQLPSAGPRPEGLCGAGAGEPAARRHGQCQPDPAERLRRRPAAGAGHQSGDRPREGERLRCHLRGYQQHHLDQSRFGYAQRLPAGVCNA